MRLVVPAFCVSMCLGGLGCDGKEIKLFEEKQFLMDTLVSITIYATQEPDNWRNHVSTAFEAMSRIERLASSFRDDSEIAQVNMRAGRDSVKVSPDVIAIMRQAQQVSRRSSGAFDVTVWPLLRLWNFKSEKPTPPSRAEIQDHCGLVDFRKIVIGNDAIFLPEEGMGLDLGSIAKGFAVDRACEVLRTRKYRDFLVEAGGDLRAGASDLTKNRRKIWVRHPRSRDSFFATIELDEGAVATSGDYERSFEVAGRRYHHLLDPKTGYPSRPVVSVTIVAETATLADALATAVFVLGPEKGLELIENDPQLGGLIVFEEETESGVALNWKVSSNLRDQVSIPQ